MNRVDRLNQIYFQKKLYHGFDYDSLYHPPIKEYLSETDVANLNYIATSAKLNGKSKEKFRMIDHIMRMRGFTRFHAGTNRLVYKSEFDSSFVMKVGIDKVGITDNPSEFYNQEVLKPFCCKVFDVSPCGTVAMIERVNPIMNRQQFEEVSDEVFYTIVAMFNGLVMEDIGCKFFMNWGMREKFGPVVLDYPYTYAMDIHKMKCTHKEGNTVCNGLIDYDIGFNTLVCEVCGTRYTARELGRISNVVPMKERLSQLEREGVETMIEKFAVTVERNGKSFTTEDSSTNVFVKSSINKKMKPSKDDSTFVATAEFPTKEHGVQMREAFEKVKPVEEFNKDIDSGIHDIVLPDGRRMRPNKIEKTDKVEESITTLDTENLVVKPVADDIDIKATIPTEETTVVETEISGKARIMREDIIAFIKTECDAWLDEYGKNYSDDASDVITANKDMTEVVVAKVVDKFSIDKNSAEQIVGVEVEEIFPVSRKSEVSENVSDAEPKEVKIAKQLGFDEDTPRYEKITRRNSRLKDF